MVDEKWPAFTNISPDSEKYKQIQLILSSANFEYIKKRALELRRQRHIHLPPDLDCNIDLTHFTSGFHNLVTELAFSDRVSWVVRIPYKAIDDTFRTSLLSEIATIKIVKKHTNIPVPQVFDFELSKDQAFGYPYVLMERLAGRTLNHALALSVPVQHHSKVAKQLAAVFFELNNLTFDRIGRLWCGDSADQTVEIIGMTWHESIVPLETSLEYFYNERQGQNRQVIATYPNDPDRLTACWVLKTALAQIILEDRVRGPFPLCHLDFHYGNLLFDDDFNLTGVVDWSNAQAAPIEQLSVCQELAIFPGLSEEENRPIVEFKRLVIQFVKEMEMNTNLSTLLNLQRVDLKQNNNLTPLSTYMASKSAEIAHRDYVDTPLRSLGTGQIVAKILYGNSISWEQLREVYGTMPLF